MCYLYFFCLHCCLINVHVFDYPDSRLSELFTEVPTSPDNNESGSTVLSCAGVKLLINSSKDLLFDSLKTKLSPVLQKLISSVS